MVQRNAKSILIENPLFHLCLGVCPALAVTTSCENALGLGVATSLVLALSCVATSCLRRFIPATVRTPAFVVIIAAFSTMIELWMSAYAPALYRALGIYVPLIAINCVILASVEGYSYKNGVTASLGYALRMGAGYIVALLCIAFFRELLGFGTVFGYQVLPNKYQPMQIMVLPPGGFIVLGLLVALSRKLGNVQETV